MFVGHSGLDGDWGGEDKHRPAKNGIRVVEEFDIYYSPSSLFNEIEKHLREGCRRQSDGEKGWHSLLLSVVELEAEREKMMAAERR